MDVFWNHILGSTGQIAFIECSPNADLRQVSWDGSPWYDLVTQIWSPAAGAKMSASSPNHVQHISCPLFVSICCIILVFVCGFFLFDILDFSLNWFFTLIALDKKGNAVQTRVIFFWSGRNKLHHRKVRINKMICFLDHL